MKKLIILALFGLNIVSCDNPIINLQKLHNDSVTHSEQVMYEKDYITQAEILSTHKPDSILLSTCLVDSYDDYLTSTCKSCNIIYVDKNMNTESLKCFCRKICNILIKQKSSNIEINFYSDKHIALLEREYDKLQYKFMHNIYSGDGTKLLNEISSMNEKMNKPLLATYSQVGDKNEIWYISGENIKSEKLSPDCNCFK